MVAEPLNSKPKFVAAKTLREPLGWQNSSLLDGELPATVHVLKRQDGGIFTSSGVPSSCAP